MHNPYNERLLKALDLLLERGVVPSLQEFCEGIDIHPTYISGYRTGKRNVQPQQLTQLFSKYGVSLYYLLIGYGPIMDNERKKDPAPPGTPEEMAQIVAVEQAKREVLEKIIAAKDEEIHYLRALLSRMIPNKDAE